MEGKEAIAARKRLAALLAAKWSRPYSVVCGYVRSRIALSLVRSTSYCLRGARTHPDRIQRPVWESATGLSLYR